MSNTAKRTNESKMENPSWEDLLAQCIDFMGDGQFYDKLVELLQSLASFDNSVVFAYNNREKPTCLADTFSQQNRAVFVDEYLKGPYLLDPFYKACSRQIKSGLYRLTDIAPDRFLQSEYYRSYYVHTDMAEELCYIFYLPAGSAVVISLMRSELSSRFSAREFRLLAKVTPVITSMAKRHWQSMAGNDSSESINLEQHKDHSLIEEAVSDHFGQRITPREIQVVAQVLEGHSSEAIATSLGISSGTVRIHRRNIYAKLQVSSQEELFSNFFKKMSTVHD
ncbi:MAG: hypothetical protein OFPI_08150 [Osedax symbiont Rs2]|nr:MAG: hypothetical protein OFPI_08150 [Osedax symbiont Rs2]